MINDSLKREKKGMKRIADYLHILTHIVSFYIRLRCGVRFKYISLLFVSNFYML